MDNDSRAYRTLTTGISPIATETRVCLGLNNITKKFGNTLALDSVSLAIQSGKVTALLGENGAGKTTLMRIAFGMLQPDAGSITVAGTMQRFMSPADAIAAGIGMVHQQFSLIPAMTVAENVALGGHGRYSSDATAFLLHAIAERTGLTLAPDARVAGLGSADRQKLEIVRALVHKAEVLILDEPTAVLTPRDRVELFTQLRKFAEEGGSVVLITHKLTDALEHADEVAVLRRGKMVLSSSMDEVNEQALVAAMLGSIPEQQTKASSSKRPASVAASLDRVSVSFRRTAPPIEVSFEIKTGEIVGVAALNGAAIPLLRVLARRSQAATDNVRLPDQIGFVPENRREEALIDDFSLPENLALADAGDKKGTIDWKAIKQETARVIADFDVRTPGIDVSPAKLSGGNQQRFVLGRELHKRPGLLVLENPTQGLDVNAAAFIHNQIRTARNEGAAVVFYSSDLDELAELSDRVVVVSDQGLIDVAAERDQIGRALLGATNDR